MGRPRPGDRRSPVPRSNVFPPLNACWVAGGPEAPAGSAVAEAKRQRRTRQRVDRARSWRSGTDCSRSPNGPAARCCPRRVGANRAGRRGCLCRTEANLAGRRDCPHRGGSNLFQHRDCRLSRLCQCFHPHRQPWRRRCRCLRPHHPCPCRPSRFRQHLRLRRLCSRRRSRSRRLLCHFHPRRRQCCRRDHPLRHARWCHR